MTPSRRRPPRCVPATRTTTSRRPCAPRAQKRGFGDSFLSLFIGHGIGIGANEPPYVGEALPGAETVELEAGMTMAIEPLIWVPDVPGGGGVRLEDTIVVAEGGGVPLTRTAFDSRLLLD